MTLFGALICGILACTLTTTFTVGIPVPDNYEEELIGISIGLGIWRRSETATGYSNQKTVTGDVKCTVVTLKDQVVNNDCANALDAKCKANKAFIILGIVSSAVAIAPHVPTPHVPAIVGGLGAGFASFSYMIVMSISISEYNGDANSTDSDCGLGYSENDNAEYGTAFYSLVAAFAFSLAGGGLSFMASMK